jgi:large subunit ribosomal protein L4
MTKNTKRVALFSALTAKFDAGEIIVVDDIKLDTYKTSAMVKMLKALGCEKQVTVTYKDAETKKIFDETHQRTCKKRTATVAEKALIVLPEVDAFVVKSCANIQGVVTTLATTINVYEILNAEKVVMTRAAVEMLQEVYA